MSEAGTITIDSAAIKHWCRRYSILPVLILGAVLMPAGCEDLAHQEQPEKPVPPPVPDTRPTFIWETDRIEMLAVPPGALPSGTRQSIPLPRATGGDGDRVYTTEPALPGDLAITPGPMLTGNPYTAEVGEYQITYIVHDSDDNRTMADADTMRITLAIMPFGSEPEPEPEPPTTGKVGVLRICPYPRQASSPDTLSIDVVYAGDMDQWLKDEIECAAAYWEHAISGDAGQPYLVGAARRGCSGLDRYFVGREIDDVRIAVHFRTQGPSATTWACAERPETGLPFYGRIVFATDNPLYGIPRWAVNPGPPIWWSDFVVQEHLDNFFDLARHEIAHVLGFAHSTAFESLTRPLRPSEGLAPSPSPAGLPVPARSDVHVFTGSNATRGYWAHSWLEGVAIADLPGVPLVGDHWTIWLWGELMHSSIVLSSRSSIHSLGSVATKITLGAFEDMGYEVDYSYADSPCASQHPLIDPGWRADHCP